MHNWPSVYLQKNRIHTFELQHLYNDIRCSFFHRRSWQIFNYYYASSSQFDYYSNWMAFISTSHVNHNFDLDFVRGSLSMECIIGWVTIINGSRCWIVFFFFLFSNGEKPHQHRQHRQNHHRAWQNIYSNADNTLGCALKLLLRKADCWWWTMCVCAYIYSVCLHWISKASWSHTHKQTHTHAHN